MQQGRILFIDAYDSFSNTLIWLLRNQSPVVVESIKIDDPRFVLNDKAFFEHLDGFDAVVAGPGPGHPAVSQDVGLISKLWTLPDEHLLPVLGICLGFQSLCLAFGAKIETLAEAQHGIVAAIEHVEDDIFAGTGKVTATLYHSLHAQLEQRGAHGCARLGPLTTSTNGLLVPLAYNRSNAQNRSVLMAVRHVSKPFWGLQYHPESICTANEGQEAISKWWIKACEWRAEQNRRDSGLCLQSTAHHQVNQEQVPSASSPDSRASQAQKVSWMSRQMNEHTSVASVASMLRQQPNVHEPIVLESGSRNGKQVNSGTGRFSIIGLPDSSSTHIRYYSAEQRIEISDEHQTDTICSATIDDALRHVDAIMQQKSADGGCPDLPFWGGFVGFISYEAALETIDVPLPDDVELHAKRPDIWYIFVARSIVIDHCTNKIYVQSLRRNDVAWIKTSLGALDASILKACENSKLELMQRTWHGVTLQEPEKHEYCKKVRLCQSQLRVGESYELCLTDQTTVVNQADPWCLYTRLRKMNPAPFGCYMRLKSDACTGVAIVGSSPERFLSWSRDGKCQFRPIKGTVKKEPGVSRTMAEEILGSSKERAENLMIVDLIRHDLNGVPGISDVRVTELMKVEEYETVFQLVSVIEGDLEENISGTTVLAASLPPGSMTGAPKKRSCEILRELENQAPRSIYSGVLGYLDVGGGGDFSVVIRTAYKWDGAEGWRIGAGGAITSLSKPEDEWDEMIAKRDSFLPSFV